MSIEEVEIYIKSYGTMMPLNQLASIELDGETWAIAPWDSTTIPEIKKAVESFPNVKVVVLDEKEYSSPTIINFFGPKENYSGRFGIEGQIKKISFTIHLFPRYIKWGYENIFGICGISFGPLCEIVWCWE